MCVVIACEEVLQLCEVGGNKCTSYPLLVVVLGHSTLLKNRAMLMREASRYAP